MKIADLKKEMDGQFDQVRARFEQVDVRFQKVDARFENIEAELRALRAEMKTEAETTRRHMDVRAEEFRDYVQLLAARTRPAADRSRRKRRSPGIRTARPPSSHKVGGAFGKEPRD